MGVLSGAGLDALRTPTLIASVALKTVARSQGVGGHWGSGQDRHLDALGIHALSFFSTVLVRLSRLGFTLATYFGIALLNLGMVNWNVHIGSYGGPAPIWRRAVAAIYCFPPCLAKGVSRCQAFMW